MKRVVFAVLLVCGLAIAAYAVYVYRFAPRGDGEKAASVSELAAALKNPEARARRKAVAELTDLGPEAAEAVPALTEALRDPDDDTRHGAALALVSIQAAEARPAIPVLVEGLKSRRSQTRVDCAWALMTFDPPPAETLPQLLEALRDANAEVRKAAGYVLAAYKKPEDTAKTVPALAALLKGRDEARTDWAWALAEIGPAAREAGPALREALKDEDEAFRQAAAFALVEIQGEHAAEAVPVLVEVLKDRDAEPKARADAAHKLAKLKANARPAVPALRELLQEKDEPLRKAAEEALKEIEQP